MLRIKLDILRSICYTIDKKFLRLEKTRSIQMAVINNNFSTIESPKELYMTGVNCKHILDYICSRYGKELL